MNIEPGFFSEHSGAISGAGSAAVTAIGFMIRQWWQDRKEEREFGSQEKIHLALIDMIRQDLLNRSQMDQHFLLVQRENAASLKAFANGLNQLIYKAGENK